MAAQRLSHQREWRGVTATTSTVVNSKNRSSGRRRTTELARRRRRQHPHGDSLSAAATILVDCAADCVKSRRLASYRCAGSTWLSMLISRLVIASEFTIRDSLHNSVRTMQARWRSIQLQQLTRQEKYIRWARKSLLVLAYCGGNTRLS